MSWNKPDVRPKHDNLILLWVVDLYSQEGCSIGYYNHDDQEYFIPYAEDGWYFVTHWQELPEAP